MKFTVTCNSPAYLRLRVPRYSINEEQSYGLNLEISRLPGVQETVVNYITGSIRIKHQGDANAIIEAVKQMSLAALPIVPEHERDKKVKIDHEFANKLSTKCAGQILRRYLLPAPLRTAWTVFKAIRYIGSGLNSLAHGRLDVEVLDGASVAMSLGFGHFNTASSIMFLLGVSDILQEYTEVRSRNALNNSLIFNVDTVWVREGDVEIQRSLSQIEIGDQVIVRSGAMIPVDGDVIEGEAGVNQSSMTGESEAVLKTVGDSVFAGTVIEEGNIVVEVRSMPDDSRIQSILALLSDNEENKAAISAKAERLADKIVPFNLAFAGLVYLFTRDGHKALSALTVDYSCAIKLCTPIAVISALSEASKNRVMVKGGKYLEALAEADTIIFDKTGTLTTSSPVVREVVSFCDMSRDDVLRLSACLEEHFPHSLARAIVHKAEEEGLAHKEEHAEVEYIVAHGVVSNWEDKRVLIGSQHFLVEDEGVVITDEQYDEIARVSNGYSVVYLAIDKKLAGIICIQDPPRPETKSVIEGLRKLGIENIVMLTGDGENVAKAISEEIGIDHYIAQVLPETKSAEVKKWQEAGHRVIMVGDGVNDSPALAAADVSVALRDSSDIAREVADVVLLDGDLASILKARQLSQRLMKRINSNFRNIILINTGLLGLGTFGIMTAEMSATIHNLSTATMSGLSTRPLLPSSEQA